MSLLSVQRKEMSFGGQLIVSAVQSFCRFLKFFNFFKPLPMLDPLFPDSYSFLPFLDLVSCFDGWSMSSSIFLRKSVLKLKILRCFIPENVFILFYTWWIIFLDVEFLLDVISSQHFNGMFHCLAVVLAIEKSAAILSLIVQMCFPSPNLKLLATSYYTWNFEISR